MGHARTEEDLVPVMPHDVGKTVLQVRRDDRRASFYREGDRELLPFEIDVSSDRGAPMGRQDDPIAGGTKVRLQRVPFEDDCYDKGGAYWGMPANLYCAWDEDGNAVYLRAPNRDAAKAAPKLKGLRFYR